MTLISHSTCLWTCCRAFSAEPQLTRLPFFFAARPIFSWRPGWKAGGWSWQRWRSPQTLASLHSFVTLGRIVTNRWMWTPTNLTKEEIVERALTIEDASWLLCERIESRHFSADSCRLMLPWGLGWLWRQVYPSSSWQEDTQISKGIREVLHPHMRLFAFFPFLHILILVAVVLVALASWLWQPQPRAFEAKNTLSSHWTEAASTSTRGRYGNCTFCVCNLARRLIPIRFCLVTAGCRSLATATSEVSLVFVARRVAEVLSSSVLCTPQMIRRAPISSCTSAYLGPCFGIHNDHLTTFFAHHFVWWDSHYCILLQQTSFDVWWLHWSLGHHITTCDETRHDLLSHMEEEGATGRVYIYISD